jgi:2-oxoisovalerate dehydrogenase E1 component alpha subunit
MNPGMHLHVPHPPARPGERADFSYLKLAPAGAVDRPAPVVAAEDTRELADSLVRVLTDDGRAIGPWNPHMTPAALLEALRQMQLTRAMDERLQRAQRQGKISFYMQSTGEEAVSIAQALALRPADMLFPSYRTQGLHIARHRPVADLMCQCLSNTRDMCKGRQMPVFYHWREGNIFSVSGNLATQLPQAVGWAMASLIKGEDHIAAAWTGEGATAEADFHHALTFAAVYRAPVLLNVVNNQWAISTFQGVAGGEQRTFAARGPACGIAGVRVDGNDVPAVYAVTQWAAERARRGAGATLIELVTYRAGAHSTSDDPTRYRPKDEWQAFPLGDPIKRLKDHLIALGAWSHDQHAALEAELAAQVAEAWEQSVACGTLKEGPRLDPATMFDDVFKTRTPALDRQRAQFIALSTARGGDHDG